MPQTRTLLAGVVRRTLGAALGLGLAWQVLAAASAPAAPGSSVDRPTTFAIGVQPLEPTGFRFTLLP